jgi:VWFA-related protein
MATKRLFPTVSLSLFWILLSIFATATVAAETSSPPVPAAAPARRLAEWPAEVAPLLSERERAAFLALADDREREAFIRRFWEVRDPYPATPVNEAEALWNSRLDEVRRRALRLDDPRTRAFLLAGAPESSFLLECPGRPPVEVWLYPPGPRTATAFLLAFLPNADGGPDRLWRHGEPVPGLASDAPAGCAPAGEIARVRLWLKVLGTDYDRLARAFLARPEVADEWLQTFVPPISAAAAAATSAGPPAETVRLDVEFPGAEKGRTLVRGVVTMPATAVAPAGDQQAHDLRLTGQVFTAREILETFRYLFRVSAPRAGGSGFPIAFERPLSPGRYTFVVRLDDLSLGRSFEGQREVAVPALDPLRARVAGGALAALGSSADRAAEGAESAPALRIAPPRRGMLTGPVTFAVHAAEGVRKVAFSLDGRLLVTRNRPPFEVELDLGSFPRPHTLRAAGLDAAGNEVAADELAVNTGTERFTVQLTEPRRGELYPRHIHARAEVHLPTGRALDRLELYLDEERVATLYQAPYSLPLVLPRPNQPATLRAVAYLPDGTRAEDLVLVNGPTQGAEVEVRLVNLYATVVDAAGRPVPDLAESVFKVREDGVPQTIRRFGRVQDLPLSAAVLLDQSASMTDRLPEVKAAADAFFRQVLSAEDRATLLTFAGAPRVAVPWTGDAARLAGGLGELAPDGGTALWDSVVYALQILGGEPGQRALLVLSDGEDNASRLRFEQALETARWAGVAIYAIGLELPRGPARDQLARLAADTGGRAFFLGRGDSLAATYGEIQRELRSRYLIAYESTHASPGGDFRKVELALARPDLTARTIRGYYP